MNTTILGKWKRSCILWIVQQWSQPSNNFGNEFNYFGKMNTKLHGLNENEVAFFESYINGLSHLTVLVMTSIILEKWKQSCILWILQQWSQPSDSFGNEFNYFGKTNLWIVQQWSQPSNSFGNEHNFFSEV